MFKGIGRMFNDNTKLRQVDWNWSNTLVVLVYFVSFAATLVLSALYIDADEKLKNQQERVPWGNEVKYALPISALVTLGILLGHWLYKISGRNTVNN
jgi:hypothetical protein